MSNGWCLSQSRKGRKDFFFASWRLGVSLLLSAAAVNADEPKLNYVRKATREETVAATLAATNGMADSGVKFGPWYFIGPFDFAGQGDFDRVYPPEKKIELDREFIGKNGAAAKWRPAPQFKDATVNNIKLLLNDDNVCGYVYRAIESPGERELAILLGSDDGIAVWLNRKKVFENNAMRPCVPDSDRLALKLRPGTNHLLMKITQGGGQWEFWFRPSPLTKAQEEELSRRLERDFPKDLEAKYYTVTRLEEPQGVALEVGGIDFAPDGKLFLCTRRGEVWAITNPPSDDPKKISWKLFASGLHEALGLTVDRKTGDVLVIQRPEITRLRDTDHDGVADVYQTFCDGWGVSGQYHEFAYGFGRDKQENLYVSLNVDFFNGSIGGSSVPWRGWVMKVTPKGELVPFAVGVRSPCGIASSPDGEIFYTDNQGDYEETCGLWHVQEKLFFGHPAGLVWRKRAWGDADPFPAIPDVNKSAEAHALPISALSPYRTRPAIWFPYGRMGQSLGQPAWDASGGKFGPFDGQIFVGDQTKSFVMRATLEKIAGKYQGACYPFRSGFDSGIIRAAFAPDGSLFVGETERGWGSVGPKKWGLQRIKWTGELPFEIHHVHLTPTGFDLTFTKPVDAATASDLKAYSITHWTMEYHQKYGSAEVGQTPAPVQQVTISPDKKTVSLKLPELVTERVYEIHLAGVRAADGSPLVHKEAYYTLNQKP